MNKNLYKYMEPRILDASLVRQGFIGFKCSKPEEYNDPYELFLSVDTNVDTQLLAFYRDSLGQLPQYPTSCFSRSPVVVPMWAHYGHASRGFVIEIDEKMLIDYCSEASVDDVEYTDSANKDLEGLLARAFVTCKPRHTFFLHKAVLHSAYFTKQSSWSYEKERRVVFSIDSIENVDGNMIAFLPTSCVKSIIAGAKATDESIEKGRRYSDYIGCGFYTSKIGKSYPEKYLVSGDNSPHIFDGSDIVSAKSACKQCLEPIPEVRKNSKLCSWCAITDAHAESATENNVYRFLDHADILERHIKGMEDIWSGKS
ncbi:Protein of unknown function (DUF2971) [Vreelandella songnenensis]|uniref:DUF2971 family protein n=1 Tax=Vreelandella songnenensis TaxID=1176243 RepID=A0A2T0V1K2_9GAMM|nr:DUF2971 domain-containing protein [Halomonas songnenensis]PRY64034.1 Protein of unknown function (DUF2971) [Halomonas songnenensis]